MGKRRPKTDNVYDLKKYEKELTQNRILEAKKKLEEAEAQLQADNVKLQEMETNFNIFLNAYYACKNAEEQQEIMDFLSKRLPPKTTENTPTETEEKPKLPAFDYTPYLKKQDIEEEESDDLQVQI